METIGKKYKWDVVEFPPEGWKEKHFNMLPRNYKAYSNGEGMFKEDNGRYIKNTKYKVVLVKSNRFKEKLEK